MDESQNSLLKLLPELERFSQTPEFGGGINLFEVAGLVKHEIRHSNILEFLLSPSRGHGIEDEFLKRLLQTVVQSLGKDAKPSALRIMLSDYSDAIVRREWMHIDIVVISETNKTVFAIENKVGAKEGKNQLSRYKEKIEACQEFKDFNKIYAFLTIDGDEGSDENWVSLSYRDILDCIKKTIAVKKSQISGDAGMLIQHYVDLIRRNILNDDDELVKECREIYSRHKNAIELILKYGVVSEFKDASDRFFSVHPELKQISSRISQTFFQPIEIIQNVPEITSMKWWEQLRPFGMWFNYIEGAEKIGLIIEVGPFGNSEFNREELANKLLSYAENNKQKISGTYTRVLTKYKKVEDGARADEILSHLNSLYDDLEPQIKEMTKIVNEFFLRKN